MLYICSEEAKNGYIRSRRLVHVRDLQENVETVPYNIIISSPFR
jgi:hypothetical protein